MPHHGVLKAGVEVASPTFRFLRADDRHFSTVQLRDVLVRATTRIFSRTGLAIILGDISTRTGGVLLPHFSHRTGRDIDILLPYTTLDGRAIEASGFLHVGADGLAYDERTNTFVRLDVGHLWALVRALLTDESGRIQWIFSNRRINILLLDWAKSLHEPKEIVQRAEKVLSEPNPGGAHDDHIHVRIACSRDEEIRGCLFSGPRREWMLNAGEYPIRDHGTLLREITTSDPPVQGAP